MVRLVANLIVTGHQHSSSGIYKALPLARAQIRKLSPVAAMSSDGIPRTRENSITKTSTRRPYSSVIMRPPFAGSIADVALTEA